MQQNLRSIFSSLEHDEDVKSALMRPQLFLINGIASPQASHAFLNME
jgi:hypothetical protein